MPILRFPQRDRNIAALSPTERADAQRRRLDEFLRDWQHVVPIGYPRQAPFYRPQQVRS